MFNNCEICGSTFESKAKAKYCEKCRKDTNKAKNKINKAISMSKARLGEYEKPKKQICMYCGKEFLSIYNRRFCSNVCSESHISDTKKCIVCGDLIYKHRAIQKNATNIKYCSSECKEKARYKEIKKCKGCNKEFNATKHNQQWCSISCFNTNRERPKRPKISVYERSCIICEKRYKTANKNKKCCSVACGKVSAHFEREKEKKFQEEQRKLMEKRSQIKGKDKPTNLCIDCKTSMKDCEWFSSNYTKHVKGSVWKEIEGKILLIKCPKYK